MKELHQTSQLNAAADSAHLQAAIGSVKWERRGFLQRLVRTSSRDAGTVRRKGK